MRNVYHVNQLAYRLIDGGHLGGNSSADYLETEGETLDELIENAVIFFEDSDGSESFIRMLGELSDRDYNRLVSDIEYMFVTGVKHIN